MGSEKGGSVVEPKLGCELTAGEKFVVHVKLETGGAYCRETSIRHMPLMGTAGNGRTSVRLLGVSGVALSIACVNRAETGISCRRLTTYMSE
jgi:hypothetical protein